MHDPVEIRRRIDRLLARLSRRDDYGELLAHRHVVRQVEDADAWRAAIRAQARADRIEVRTGADGCAVSALLVDRPDDDTGDGEYMAALKEMSARAAALRHEPALVARHRSEMLISCDRCPALGYADAEDHVIGGSLLDTGCPNEEEPQETPLSVVWGTLVVRLPCPGTEQPLGARRRTRREPCCERRPCLPSYEQAGDPIPFFRVWVRVLCAAGLRIDEACRARRLTSTLSPSACAWGRPRHQRACGRCS